MTLRKDDVRYSSIALSHFFSVQGGDRPACLPQFPTRSSPSPPGQHADPIVHPMTILQANRFSSLVGEIYDAAANPALRSAALEQVSNFVGGCAATILSRDAARLSIEIHEHFGTDTRFRQLYRDRYVELDPLLDRHLDFAAGQTVGVADIMPQSDFEASSFYREWVEPQGAIDLATVTLEKTVARTTILQVLRHRSRGTVDDAMRERMRLLAPHIQRSRVMGRQIRARSHTVDDLADVLDGLSTAICLLDAEGRVVHANASCRQLFVDANLLAMVGDRIVGRNTQADKIFRGLFEFSADAGTHSNGSPSDRARDIVRRTSLSAPCRSAEAGAPSAA
ncbi:PAS domain-containing protein [Bradyrhizobium diazoefficiens]